MGELVLSSRSIGVLAEAIEAGNSATTMGTLFLKADVDRGSPRVRQTSRLERQAPAERPVGDYGGGPARGLQVPAD
jgi:hypothetical protein